MNAENGHPVQRLRRRGVAVIWVVVMLVVMIAFGSLAVDLGRVVTTKTELRRAADAAARAAAGTLSSSVSNTSVINAAKNMAALNVANGNAVTLNTADIQWGVWNTASRTFTPSANANSSGVNAVKITARCTQANGNPVALMIGQMIGASTCDVSATSIAMLGSSSGPSVTQFVTAHGNPWLSGEPNGATASEPDSGYPSARHPWKLDVAGPTGTTNPNVDAYGDPANEPYGSPTQFGGTGGNMIQLVPGDVITFTLPNFQTETAKNDPSGGGYNAQGYNGGSMAIYINHEFDPTVSPEHGIANIHTPIDSLVGVFLTDSQPDPATDSTPIPSALNFTTQSSRDYTSLSPQLKQPFYIGNGLTSSGVQQQIVVPNGATRLYLGTMDGHEWSNNVGGFTVTATQSSSGISIVQ